MQHGVEHSVRPLHPPSGHLAHPLDDRVTIALLLGQDRQDDWGGRSSHQVLADLHDFTHRATSSSSVHSSTIHCSTRYVNNRSPHVVPMGVIPGTPTKRVGGVKEVH